MYRRVEKATSTPARERKVAQGNANVLLIFDFPSYMLEFDMLKWKRQIESARYVVEVRLEVESEKRGAAVAVLL